MTKPQASVSQVKPANKRGVARLAAVQALYQMEITNSGIMEIVAEYEASRLGHELDGEQYLDADASWFRGIVSGVVGAQKELDPLIHRSLTNDWPLSRIDTLLRQVLRAGVFELTHRKDVPARVVINEYVDVAKAFFEDDEPRMVNGVLDRIAKSHRDDITPKNTAETEPKSSEQETADNARTGDG